MSAKPRLVDLHTHTTASDGVWTPDALVDAAALRGLAVVAVTDHDTVAGVAAVAERGAAAGMTVVPGVELSCGIEMDDGETREAHVVGLFVDPVEGAAALAAHAERRRERMARMLARMDALGLPSIETPEGLDAPGRPHLARALVARGIVRTVGEAFARYLRDGGPLDEPKVLMPLADATALIHNLGGVALLAHPGLGARGLGFEAWLEANWPVGAAGPRGLDGVEAYHPKQGPELTARLLRFAHARGAAVTGGSDTHGPDGGAPPGTPAVPFAVYEALAARAAHD